MMLTVHGLPSNVKYQELKALIRQKCSITQFILDNLVPEEDGTKKVRIGVADENEGSILMRNLDGFLLNGYRLRVQPVGKAPLLTTPKQANYDSRVNYEHRPEYGQQAMDPHGPNRVLYPAPTTRPASYPYQHAGDVPQQPKVDSGPYPQREVYIHRQQDQSYGYTSKPVPVAAEDRRVVEVRPHILRTVELDRGSVPKPYQPTPQAFAQPQQKPVTIFKDNFQGPTQGYNFNQMNQPMQQSYQGRQDVARSTWAQDQNKQPAYGKPSTPSYDKPVYEDRKFIHHSLAEAPQTRGLLKTPTNYDQPKYSHTSQVTRMSSPRRASSPARRVSPDKRLISPQGRQDLRKVSPNRRLSPRRRISPNRRASPRKSPTSTRRLLSPPQTRVSPSKRQYYEDLEKYSSRPSGPSAPQARFTYEKQTAQNQYSGGYGSSSSQNRAPPPVKSSVPWQGTKPIHPRDSPIERDSIRHAPESKYQSSAKSAYPRYSSAEREIGRPTQENQYRQITKSIYPRDSPTQHGVTKHIPANKYQHFDIPSAKEVHRSAASAPLKRSSRSPVRRIRTPPRRSPRKQSPAHQPWASERQRSPVPRSPPPPPAWSNRPHTEKEQSIVWQRSDEVEQQLDLRRKPGDDWKKEASGFGGIRDKYEDRIDLARRSGDGAPYEKYRKYNDDSRRPPSPQRKDYYSRQEEDRERREFKPKLPDRSEQGTKRHEDYAAGPDVYSKHQGGFTKYPEPFTKRPEPFDEKSHEHSYKRQEMQAGRHRPFSDDRSQFPNRPEPPQNLNLPHHKHQNTFPKRQGLLLKYEEPVPKFQEPRHKYEEPFAKRQEPLLKYTKLAIKHQGSYSRAIEPLARHQERQEPLRARQDQYQIHRDDCYISQENRKHSEGFQYRDANRKHIDSRTGRSADAPLYEANAVAQKPETSFKELTKRAQDWAQGIGNYGSLTAEEEDRETTMDPQLRQKVINLITRKILARHNVKMRDERQKKISIRLRKMIEKRVNNIIGEKSTDLIKIQHKFRTTYSVQDEDKMYFDAVAAYSPARQNEDSGGRSQNVAKEDDRGQTEPYFGTSSKKTRWSVQAYSDDQLHSAFDEQFQTVTVDMALQGLHPQWNECGDETYNLYLCKDDFSTISSAEADKIRQFLVSKVFDATANCDSDGWVPSFMLRGLRSFCRYEVGTNDELSKVWLEKLDFSELEDLHIIVYNKEELWYERGAIWLPGHSKYRIIEPLNKLRLQNWHMTAIDLDRWKLVRTIVTSLGTRIYVDMPPSSARALESQQTLLSYELQKVSVFLKAVAIDKSTFDAGLRDQSVIDNVELMTAILNTPMPSIKNQPNLIKVGFKGRRTVTAEQAKSIKEIIVSQLYKYHLTGGTYDRSRTDFLKYGFCLPGYLGVLPENKRSAYWLIHLDLGSFNRQELVCFGGETDYENRIKMTMFIKSARGTNNKQTILRNLEVCNRRVEGLNCGDWAVSSFKIMKHSVKATVEMDVDSARALADNKFTLDYVDSDVLFTHAHDDFDAIIDRRREEQTEIYDVTNMEIESD